MKSIFTIFFLLIGVSCAAHAQADCAKLFRGLGEGIEPLTEADQVIRPTLLDSDRLRRSVERRQKQIPSEDQKERRRKLKDEGFEVAALNQEVVDQYKEFLDKYEHEVTNLEAEDQKQTGECWLFAMCGIIQSSLVEQGVISPDFKFSKTYLNFVAVLEKSQKILTQIAYRVKPKMTDDAFLAETLKVKDAVDEGGWFNWAAFLIKKYGLVPVHAMKQTLSAEDNTKMVQEIQAQVLTSIQRIRTYVDQIPAGQSVKDAKHRKMIVEIIDENYELVFDILSDHLVEDGKEFPLKVSVKPKDSERVRNASPQYLRKEVFKFDPDEYVVVTHYPDYKKEHYIVNDSGIGPRGQSQIHFLNLGIKRMEELIIASLSNAETPRAVMFSADVSLGVDSATGLMHPKIHEPAKIHGTDPKNDPAKILTKDSTGQIGMSGEGHAMVMDAVQIEKDGKKVFLIRIHNSWGAEIGDRGDFHMTREFLVDRVDEIVIHKSLLTPVEQKMLDAKPLRLSNQQFFGG